ncbi:hypothetical protein C6P45_002189 [Maudiozyma exigua]|uniref:Rad21/Rec8-like protein N-terminal domain-containing protein n=1 Tax=Maudiozyma exigua TaxID=34358 RepID=A0A9P6VXB2_MAUEX|nr:hypothetical protein C6P45_002189 [Kazachstania exigua]
MEVITNESQNNGISTVWALATLGGLYESRHLNKKDIKKKQILDVSIPDTCDVIQLNSDGITLRQVSSLLYGVTLCYHRKTEYFLSDINAILSQLTRAISYNSNLAQVRGRTNIKSFTLQTLSNYLSTRSKQFFGDNNTFLKDDKRFDIQQIPSFKDFLDDQSPTFGVVSNFEPAIIRRKDYITELSNSNYPGRDNFVENIIDSQSNKYDFNPSLDDIPIDMDFELDINDVVSRGGSSVVTDHTEQSNIRNFDLEKASNFNSNFNGSRLEEELLQPLDIDLAIEKEASQADHLQNETGETLQNEPNTKIALKKRKIHDNSCEKQYTYSIVVDSRIGIPTETLRNCHENYVIVMQQDTRNSRLAGTKRKRVSLGDLLSLENEVPLVKKSWEDIFSNSPLFDVDSRCLPITEQGRRNDISTSLTHSNNGSIRSTEYGRRESNVSFGLSQFNKDDSLLLNLDQINDEIMEGDLNDTSVMNGMEHSKQSGDYINMNLRLLSSSVGRNLSRYSTSNNLNSDEPDLVDALTRRINRSSSFYSRESDIGAADDRLSSFESSNNLLNQNTENGLGVQARKFYQFIKERALFDNITVDPLSHFSRKLTFESIVPSNAGNESEFGGKKISKRVVCGAFFTLLTLASQEMIEITISERVNNNDSHFFATNNGTDIMINI